MKFPVSLEKMKVFCTLQKFMSILGIQPHPAQQLLFNSKSILAFIFIVRYGIFTIAGLLFDAKTFGEYAESFYAIMTGFIVVSNFSTMTLKMSKIFRLIEQFDDTIQKRKFQLNSNFGW